MRSPLLAAILALSVVLAAAIAGFLLIRGVGQSSPLDCLPQETRLFFRAPDPTRLWRAVGRTSLGDPSSPARDFLGDLMARHLESHGLSQIPVATGNREWMAGESVLALIESEGSAGIEPALIVATRHTGGQTLDQVRTLLTSAAPDPASAVPTPRRHRAREYLELRAVPTSPPVFLAAHKGVVILSSDGATMRRILETIDGKAEPLRSSPAYRAVMDTTARRADLSAYFSGAWLRQAIEARLGAGAGRRTARALGLRAVRSAGVAVNIRGQLFHETLRVSLEPGSSSLVAQLFDEAPRAPRPLKHLTPGFPYYMALSTSNLNAAYRTLPDLLAGASDPERTAIRERIRGAEEFMELDLGRDLFGAIGGEMAIGFGSASVYPRGASNRALYNTPGMASLSLRDRGAVTRIMGRIDGLARALDGYQTSLHGDQEMTSYEFTTLAPMRPSYVFKGRYLIAATSPDLFKTPAQVPQEVARCLDLLPRKIHLLLVADTSRLMDRVASPLSPEVWVMIPEPLRSRLAGLALRRDLHPTAAAGRLKGGVMTVESVSPASAALLGALLIPSRAQEPGN